MKLTQNTVLAIIGAVGLGLLLNECRSGSMSSAEIAARLAKSTVGIKGHFKVWGLVVDDDYSWSGSGVLISRDGGHYTILSNAHVIGTDAITDAKWFMEPRILAFGLEVKMPDGQIAPARAVFVNNHRKDFALVHVDASVGNYPILPLKEQRVEVGAQVFAMGDPLGLSQTFSSGTVSAHRSTKTGVELVQHTAPISHGNSGGPLVDDHCTLLGINTMVFDDGTAQNLNFAITAHTIMQSGGEWVTFPLTPPEIGPFVVRLKKGQASQ